MKKSVESYLSYLNDTTWYCYDKYNPAPYWRVQDAIVIIEELVDKHGFSKEQLRRKFSSVFEQIDIINNIKFEDYQMHDKCRMDYIQADNETLIKMCSGCENYIGENHDYKECWECIPYRLFMQVKLLEWHRHISDWD